MEELYNYLASNKLGLIQYNLRKNIELPKPTSGVEYRTLGTMEHNICDLLAFHLKGRKRNWTNKFIGILRPKMGKV